MDPTARTVKNAKTGLWMGLGALGGIGLGIFLLIKNLHIGWALLAIGLILAMLTKQFNEREEKKRTIREALHEFDEDRRL